jgi:NitT/TauT family transport system ATP-binding protein/nitrate/nitrite transport system substrate-binding protein
MTRPHVAVGFHPLNDAALLMVADAKGLFADEGLDVTLSKEPSWSNIRDKLAYGVLDAAHMLAPMTLASTLGLGAGGGRLIAPIALGLNGDSVVVSSALASAIAPASRPEAAAGAVGALIRERRSSGGDALVFAAPFPFSPQMYILRDWLSAGGVDPDRDVRLVVVPPSRMADMLRKGVLDGFCAGAPWGQDAALSGAGRILFSDPVYWGLKPEKVLGVSPRWAAEEPDALRALLRALLRGALWVREAGNRTELIAILSEKRYVGATPEVIAAAFEGELAAGHIFFDAAATFPWLSHAEWFVAQMVRWGQAPPTTDAASVARAVYRPDLWRAAAKDLGLSAPARDSKIEGAHALPWTLPGQPDPIAMPPDLFFDSRRFEPAAGG